MHALAHMIWDLETRPAVNVWVAGNNFMEEDWIGKCMDHVNALDSRTMTQRVLEFASASLRLLLERRALRNE